jgi:hypothetical protein
MYKSSHIYNLPQDILEVVFETVVRDIMRTADSCTSERMFMVLRSTDNKMRRIAGIAANKLLSRAKQTVADFVETGTFFGYSPSLLGTSVPNLPSVSYKEFCVPPMFLASLCDVDPIRSYFVMRRNSTLDKNICVARAHARDYDANVARPADTTGFSRRTYDTPMKTCLSFEICNPNLSESMPTRIIELYNIAHGA